MDTEKLFIWTNDLIEYPCTNDIGLVDRISEIKSLAGATGFDENDVAVQIGTGGLSSIADVMPDTVYVTDIDRKLLKFEEAKLERIRTCSTPDKFIGTHIPFWLRREFDVEKELFGDQHFLDNQNRYDTIREALSRITVEYRFVDYSKPFNLAKLGNELSGQNQKVKVFNPTNVHQHLDWYRGIKPPFQSYIDSLAVNLPWADGFGIVASRSQKGYVTPLSHQLVGSLVEYQNLINDPESIKFSGLLGFIPDSI